MNEKYANIINRPHHVSSNHPQMSLEDRAAQFAPFAALAGYDDMVKETARVVDGREELGEDQLEELNYKINYIQEHIKSEPVVSITFFVPDSRKEGGKYITEEGNVKRINKYNQTICFKDGTVIPIGDIIKIESDDIPTVW